MKKLVLRGIGLIVASVIAVGGYRLIREVRFANSRPDYPYGILNSMPWALEDYAKKHGQLPKTFSELQPIYDALVHEYSGGFHTGEHVPPGATVGWTFRREEYPKSYVHLTYEYMGRRNFGGGELNVSSEADWVVRIDRDGLKRDEMNLAHTLARCVVMTLPAHNPNPKTVDELAPTTMLSDLKRVPESAKLRFKVTPDLIEIVGASRVYGYHREGPGWDRPVMVRSKEGGEFKPLRPHPLDRIP